MIIFHFCPTRRRFAIIKQDEDVEITQQAAHFVGRSHPTLLLNAPQAKSIIDSGSPRWYRSKRGTYLMRESKDGRQKFRIANCGVAISKIVFRVNHENTAVEFTVTFTNEHGATSTNMTHADLSDEARFHRAAVPGFTVTSYPKAFAELRECMLSELAAVECEAVLTATGWYRLLGREVFAHAKGLLCSEDFGTQGSVRNGIGTTQAISLLDVEAACSDVPLIGPASSAVRSVRVELPPQLEGTDFSPPESVTELEQGIRAVLELLEIGDPNVTFVSVGALFFTAMRNPRFALFLYGPTGSLKTAFAVLLLSFFQPGSKESDFESFASTANAIRERFASTSNVAVGVDDYVQLPGSRTGGPETRKAEDFIRSVVNGTGKGRCVGSGQLQKRKQPRGLPLITGEQLPDGLESLRHRCLCIKVTDETFKESASGVRPNEFDRMQEFAADGTFAKTMASFISWAAKEFWQYQEFLDDPKHALETCSVHRRVVEAAESVLSGMSLFLTFAQHYGVITEEQFDEYGRRSFEAADHQVAEAYRRALDDSPTARFRYLLAAALSSLSCHIKVEDKRSWEKDTGVPLQLLGYQGRSEPVEEEEQEGDTDEPTASDGVTIQNFRTTHHPIGKEVGRTFGECIDLVPDLVVAEANRIAVGSGATPVPTPKAFGQMLAKEGWLAATGRDRNTYKVRRGKATVDVWRIHCHRLFEVALPFGDFDTGAYRQMTEVEQLRALTSKQNEHVERLKRRIHHWQVDRLLNNELTVKDEMRLAPDPSPDSSNVSDTFSSPPPIEPPDLMGNGIPPEDYLDC
ncbi:MAG: hypothetical protein Aurels2KO_55570 [Aureliella sp.]